MGVDDDVPGLGLEPKRIRLMGEQLLNELLEEEATAGNALHPIELELAVILHEHGVARGLQEKDGRGVHVEVQQRQVVLAEPHREVEIALAEGWPPATLPPNRQSHLEPGGFEDLHRRNTDMGLVIAHERIVPKHNPAARALRWALAALEPTVEALPGVVWQGTLPGEAQRFRQNAAHEERVQRQVGEPWHPASELAHEIHRADQPLTPAQAVPLYPRVQKLGLQQRQVDVRGALGRAG